MNKEILNDAFRDAMKHWNSIADQYNQWSELDINEKFTQIVRALLVKNIPHEEIIQIIDYLEKQGRKFIIGEL